MKTWLTSDFHYNHSNICRGTSKWSDLSGTRPFSTIEEMNSTILDNLNSLVMPEDQLFFLGDFCFGDKSLTGSWRSKIKCRDIFFIRGNHDHGIDTWKSEFRWIKDYFELRYKGIIIPMFHYPIASFNHQHHGGVHAFGHCHGSFQSNGPSIDVGVDTNDFKPYFIDDFIEICRKKPVFVGSDYHK
jgi:calcineurin-like phosphoesterase family protein